MKIEIQEDEFLKEVSRIMEKLNLISIDSNLKNEFESFFKIAIKEGDFEENKYIELATNVINAIKDKLHINNAKECILDLSRLHCKVEEIYMKFGLFKELMAVAAKNPKDYTDCNQVFIGDLVYSHYYWKAREIHEKSGMKDLLLFLSNDKYLSQTDGGFVFRTIVNSLIEGLFKKDKSKLSIIKEKYGNDAVIRKKLDRYLMEK